MAPVYDRIGIWVGEILSSLFPKWKKSDKYAKMIATLACLVILILVVFALIMMIIPELVNSITNVISYAPSGTQNLEAWLKDILNKNPNLEKLIIGNYLDISERLSDIATTTVLPNVNTYIKNLSSGVINALGVVVNIIIGIGSEHSETEIAVGLFTSTYSGFSCPSKRIVNSSYRAYFTI